MLWERLERGSEVKANLDNVTAIIVVVVLTLAIIAAIVIVLSL